MLECIHASMRVNKVSHLFIHSMCSIFHFAPRFDPKSTYILYFVVMFFLFLDPLECFVFLLGPFDQNDETKLKYYSYYKQATEGKCTKEQPYFIDYVNRAKW